MPVAVMARLIGVPEQTVIGAIGLLVIIADGVTISVAALEVTTPQVPVTTQV